MKKSTLIFWFIILLLLITFGVVVFFRLQPPEGPMDPKTMPQAVKVVEISPTKIDVTTTTQATITAKQRVAMTPEIQGLVQQVLVTEGQRVGKGTPLIRLKGRRQRAQLAQSYASVVANKEAATSQQAAIQQAGADVTAAQSQANLAKTEFSDYEALYRQDVISRLELDQRRATLDNANAALSAAEQRLAQTSANFSQSEAAVKQAQATVALQQAGVSETIIRAPFSGVVGEITVDPGDTVAPGQAVVTILGTRGLEVVFELPERFLHQLRVGQLIHLSATQPQTLSQQSDSEAPTHLITSRVSFIDPVIDPATRTLTVKGPVSAGSHVADGQFVTASVVLATRPNAMVVPESAIIPQGERTYVYVAKPGETLKATSDKAQYQWNATFTEVALGARQTGQVEITEGLAMGDWVITDGVLKLFDGAKLAITNKPKHPSAENKPSESNNATNTDVKTPTEASS